MYCHQCGKEVENEVKFCPYCGVQIEERANSGYQPINSSYQQNSYAREDDAPSGGFAILSFILPVVGLILYLVWNNEYPKKAKSCLKGLIVGVVVYVVGICCMFSILGSIFVSEDYYSDDHFNFNAVVETIPYE